MKYLALVIPAFTFCS